MRIKDNFRISKSHWYGFLPRRLQYYLISIAIKLGFIHRYGKLEVIVTSPDGKVKKSQGYNILTDVGLKHLGDILVGTEVTNLTLGFIEPGSGTTTPVVGDTDTETALTPADRLAATVLSRGGSSPFEVVVESFITSTKYTRPQTINELAIFFGPDESGDIFARGLLAVGVTLNANDTASILYGFIWR